MFRNCSGSGGRGGFVCWSSVFIKAAFKSSFRFTYVLPVATQTMYHVNKIFRVVGNAIMNGSHFLTGRKGIICTAVRDIAAGNAIFALPHSKDPLVTLVCLSVRNLDLTKMSLWLSVCRKATRSVV